MSADPVRALLRLPKFGRGLGLFRVRDLLKELDDAPWWRGLDALKVTGSNGKGSVSAMAAALLEATGLPCGLYTSPHRLRFHERIRIGGEEIADHDLETSVAWLLERIRREGLEKEIGAFEAFTVLAMHHFTRQQPAAVVLEAGIGGRYDPTRVPPGRHVALTSVDREHIPLLGDNEEEILYQKADLCPDGGTLVAGPLTPKLRRCLRAYTARPGIRLLLSPEEVQIELREATARGSVVDLQMDDLQLEGVKIALPGRHQLDNAAVALLLVREWLRAHHPERLERFPDAIRAAFAAVHWPGQLELVSEDPDIFVDYAHTPDAIAKLTASVRKLIPGPLLLVTGVSQDKDIQGILSNLLRGLPEVDRILCTRAHHKGAPVETIHRLLAKLRPEADILRAETIEATMARALEIGRQEGYTVLVAGGLFLAAEAAHAARGGDPAALRFF